MDATRHAAFDVSQLEVWNPKKPTFIQGGLFNFSPSDFRPLLEQPLQLVSRWLGRLHNGYRERLAQ